jgi:hypothetical protein
MTEPRDPDDVADLDTETVEDLDLDDDTSAVKGGTVLNTGGCVDHRS